MTTYKATAPDGKEFTRISSRIYTHALAHLTPTSNNWAISSFAGSKDAAEKRMKQLQKFYGGQWQIVETTTE